MLVMYDTDTFGYVLGVFLCLLVFGFVGHHYYKKHKTTTVSKSKQKTKLKKPAPVTAGPAGRQAPSSAQRSAAAVSSSSTTAPASRRLAPTTTASQRLRARMQDAANSEEMEPLVPPVGQTAHHSDDDSDLELGEGQTPGATKKIGVKKAKKLLEKEEKKKEREEFERQRDERKRQEAIEDAEKKKEQQREAELAAQEAADAELAKQEKEKRDLEEYLLLKESFVVEEEGVEHVIDDGDAAQNLLQEFLDHIKATKVVMLEDLCAKFNIKTQMCLDFINLLQERDQLSGVLDDRGKFIYVTEEEYQEVAKFIKQRGRVTLSELLENSNRLISLRAS